MATNGEGKQNEAGRHQEVGHKSLLQSDALYQVYIYISILPSTLRKRRRKNFIMRKSIVKAFEAVLCGASSSFRGS